MTDTQECPRCFGKGLENQDDRPGLLLGATGEDECRHCHGSGRVPLATEASPRPWYFDGRDIFSTGPTDDTGGHRLVVPLPNTFHPSQRVSDADAELIVAAVNAYDRMRDALEEIGLPGHVPDGFDPLEWWQHTACKRGEIARDALGVTAEELIAKKWHEHVEATR